MQYTKPGHRLLRVQNTKSRSSLCSTPMGEFSDTFVVPDVANHMMEFFFQASVQKIFNLITHAHDKKVYFWLISAPGSFSRTIFARSKVFVVIECMVFGHFYFPQSTHTHILTHLSTHIIYYVLYYICTKLLANMLIDFEK